MDKKVSKLQILDLILIILFSTLFVLSMTLKLIFGVQFVAWQAVGAFVFLVAQPILRYVTKLKIPYILTIYLNTHVFMGMFLGELYSFYALIPVWDDILHASSGFFFVLLGIIFITDKTVNLSNTGFILFFLFCFSLMTSVLWEVMEFTADSLGGLNMQGHADKATNVPFVGLAALYDTMMDLILNMVGALVGCVAVGVCYKHNIQPHKYFKFEKQPKVIEVLAEDVGAVATQSDLAKSNENIIE